MKPNPAWRGDPTFLPELFKHFGINFKELPGWEFWGMGDFASIQGVFWHHTGSRVSAPSTSPIMPVSVEHSRACFTSRPMEPRRSAVLVSRIKPAVAGAMAGQKITRTLSVLALKCSTTAPTPGMSDNSTPRAGLRLSSSGSWGIRRLSIT